jgi:hypothetical protein
MATTYRSEPIIEIVDIWLKWAERSHNDTTELWYLYDLACGRNLPLDRARKFVAKMDASKERVRAVVDWLCKLE